MKSDSETFTDSRSPQLWGPIILLNQRSKRVPVARLPAPLSYMYTQIDLMGKFLMFSHLKILSPGNHER